MNWKQSTSVVIFLSLIVAVVSGCDQNGESVSTAEQTPSTVEEIARPEGWTDETHGDNVDPNYDVVFPEDKVNQIKITITPDNWEKMQENMIEMFGEAGTQQQDRIPRDGAIEPNFNLRPDTGGFFPGTDNFTGGRLPGADRVPPDRGDINPDIRNQGIPGWVDTTRDNPVWVPATIEFNSVTWTNVGVRYKGNSSLANAWRSGSLNVPLKLDFDEFEDEYPEIDNQRFYGFKQLSFSNAFTDSTYMHDVITADILAEAGLVAAETTYYEVIMDYGEGPVNLGLYVVIEVIDDTVIDHYFDDDSGNIYEGDGPGTSLAQGTFNQIESSFQKENNVEEADWSDIEELFNILHSSTRTSDAEAWKEHLESIFNVDTFLEWLAISAIIQHWDTYGSMTHNFYLYNDPDTGLLTWISWDHNQVLAGSGGARRGGIGLFGGGTRGNISLSRQEVGQNWPLIRYLLDDPVYYERYIKYIEETINGAFNPDKLAELCQELAELIEPYVTQDTSNAAFETAVQELIDRIYERFEVASTFLAAGS
jgi:spore coat protein H